MPERTEVLVADGVWGDAFAELSSRWTVSRCAAGADLPLDQLAHCRALVVQNRTQVTAALLAKAPRLEVVCRAGVGLDNLDLAALDATGVVAVAPLGANAVSVAEHAVAMALAMAKGLVGHDRRTRAGGWERLAGRELAGGIWGVVSAGATGRATARLARGLGMEVVGYDPHLDPADPQVVAAGIRLTNLADVFDTADVVSIHLPATADTHRMIDRATLSRLKPGAMLVNVGRGEVIDEEALADLLEAGQLGGVALDVRAVEPPTVGRLERSAGSLFSPHVAGITGQAQSRIGEVLTQQIDLVLGGAAATATVGSLVRPSRPTAAANMTESPR